MIFYFLIFIHVPLLWRKWRSYLIEVTYDVTTFAHLKFILQKWRIDEFEGRNDVMWDITILMKETFQDLP